MEYMTLREGNPVTHVKILYKKEIFIFSILGVRQVS